MPVAVLLEPAVGYRKERIFVAMFHFRLKSDKKPNGTKISSVKHVEYINREGSFSHDEHWQEKNKFVGDCITTAQTPNVLDGLETLLYKTDDFGSIKNSLHGIEVTENASTTTLSIALMLAIETTNNQPLIINGSPDFHKAVLQTALLANLPITFADRLAYAYLPKSTTFVSFSEI